MILEAQATSPQQGEGEHVQVGDNDQHAQVEPKEDSSYSRKLADLSRKERARVQKEMEFKNQLTDWENKKKEVDPILESFNSFKTTKDLKAALKLLEVAGISYEDLTNAILEEPSEESSNSKEPQKSISELVEEELNKRDAARKEKELDEQLNSYKSNFETLIADGDFKALKRHQLLLIFA